MNLSRTRSYVPSKLIWGALTAKLTPLLGIRDYQKVGIFLKKAMRFGYLYLYAENQYFIPHYTKTGLNLGSWSQNEFETKFISSMPSTAIDSGSSTAEEEMLHEIEFISPYVIGNKTPTPVFLKGLLWVRETEEAGFELSIDNNGIILRYNNMRIDFKKELFNRFQIGGERRYGFGLVALDEREFIEVKDNKLDAFAGEWSTDSTDVYISLKENDCIWAHLAYSQTLNLKGNIEPLVGRDWDPHKGPGRQVRSYGFFWSPGSSITEDMRFRVAEFGIWSAVKT